MKLHIGNLAKNVSDTELSEMVTAIAPAMSVEIVRDPTGASKGFGFAEFATPEQAQLVMAGLNGRDISGQTLKLGEAKPRRNDARPRA